MTDAWRGKVVLFVNGLDGTLESSEKGLGSDKGRVEIDGVGKLVHYVV